MTDPQILDALADQTVLAGTMWAEARGDGREGHSSVEERIAVGCVVRNRLAHFARYRAAAATYKAVCLAPLQFSCWNPGSGPNHSALMTLMERVVLGFPVGDPVFTESVFLAGGIIGGQVLDRTAGSDCYYAPAAMQPAGRVPDAALGKSPLAIGAQLFYRAS